jgi:hypothetical protein
MTRRRFPSVLFVRCYRSNGGGLETAAQPMSCTIAAAVIVMLVTTAAPATAFSKDEKSPNECGKYLSEMSQDLDILEALVPNVPPEEASYLEKEDAAAIQTGGGKRIYALEHRPLYPHGIFTMNLIGRESN